MQLLILGGGLALSSALFVYLETVTHQEFFLHLAAIPLEILVGAVLVGAYLANRDRKRKLKQLGNIKGFLFRSEMRNIFIYNFRALDDPRMTLDRLEMCSIDELKNLRDTIDDLTYSSDEAIESVLNQYVTSNSVFVYFMQWAVDNQFESIFRDMIYLLHFIQDVRLFKERNPQAMFITEAESHPQMMDKVHKVLRDNVRSFLDYAIELKHESPEQFAELCRDYSLSAAYLRAHS